MANSLNKITTKSILDATVATADIAADAVTGAKIADEAIDSEHITPGAVDANHIAAQAINDGKISSGAVITAKIADDAVTLAKMAGLARGKMIVGDGNGDPAALAAGSNGQVLTMNANGDAAWAAAAGGTALTGSTNNTITTVTGADAIQGEANLTYDGTNLQAKQTGDTAQDFIFDSNRSAANNVLGRISGYWDTDRVADITLRSGSDTTNKDDGEIAFRTSTEQGAIAERMRITSAGNVGIGTTSPGGFKLRVEGGDSDEGLHIHTGNSSSQWLIRAEDNAANQRFVVKADGEVVIGDGNLVIGTAGHGIDFSATGNESAMTSELLDTYEEGSFTPTLTNGPSISQEEGRYIRIGKVVHCWWRFVTSNDGPAAHCRMHLPFTSNSDNNGPPNGGTAWDYHTSEVDAHLSQGSNAVFFYQATAALNGDNAQIESEDFRGCTTYEVA